MSPADAIRELRAMEQRIGEIESALSDDIQDPQQAIVLGMLEMTHANLADCRIGIENAWRHENDE